jgi:mRNA interferase MazF
MARPIHLCRLDKARPALVLTRPGVRNQIGRWTVAPITSTIRGLLSEFPVGKECGLDNASVASLDNVATIARADVGRLIGFLPPEREAELAEALRYAYDLV